MREVRQAIREGSLWELVEQRSRAHPRLLAGLQRALSHSGWIEKFQPASGSTFFYSGPESSNRPEVLRHGKKLLNLRLEGRVLIRNHRLGDENDFDWVLDFKPPFGPYPLLLGETYPLNAEVTDEPDHESLTVALRNILLLMENNPDSDFTVVLDGLPEHPLMKEVQRCKPANGVS